MAWGKASSTTLSSSGDNISSGTITASKCNQYMTHISDVGGQHAVDLRFNNDTGNNYAFRRNNDGGTDATTTSTSHITFHSSEVTEDLFSNVFTINISSEEKLVIGHTIQNHTLGASTAPKRKEFVGKWVNTSSQVTEIDLSTYTGGGDYNTGSNLSALGSEITPAAAIPFPENVELGSRAEITDTRKIYAYGSDIITDGDYTVLKYTADGTFTPTSSFDVEYLVVGGGGGGGDSFSKQAGGGGAGGYLTGTGHSVTAQTYNITVGAGGAGSTSTSLAGTSGSNSIFSSFTAIGGGGGGKGGDGAQSAQNGLSGGSGGGGGGSGYTNNGGSGGTATSGQGYAGGAGNKSSSTGGSNSANGRAGGGGGASQVGRNGATDATGSFGGAGLSNSITGTAYTYSAGGEGGANHNQNSHDDGLYYGDGGSGDSGSGANGVVIIRFLTSGNTYTSSIGNSWKEIGA
jgi:hypothetical protein